MTAKKKRTTEKPTTEKPGRTFAYGDHKLPPLAPWLVGISKRKARAYRAEFEKRQAFFQKYPEVNSPMFAEMIDHVCDGRPWPKHRKAWKAVIHFRMADEAPTIAPQPRKGRKK